MKEQWQALRTWFLSRERRERIILLAGSVALVLMLVYVMLIGPFFAHKAAMQQRIARNTELLHWMQIQAVTVQRLRGTSHNSHISGTHESLLAAADRTARAAALGHALKQIQPATDGSGAVRVRLEEASFDNLIRWLGTLQRHYAIRTTQISIDQGHAANTVDVNLTLKRGA
jgi:type II secretory pathway component PulM